MPKYSVTIAQDTFLLLEAKRLGTDEADALRILIEVAMTREPKQHCASPSSVSQIFYPVPTPYSDCSFAAWLVQQARRDDGTVTLIGQVEEIVDMEPSLFHAARAVLEISRHAVRACSRAAWRSAAVVYSG